MTDNKLIDRLDNDNIPVFSVSEITSEITNLLEDRYSYVKIKGEISGETGDRYPEIYFKLKDEKNVISAIIKRNKIPLLKLLPKDGLEVVCTGKITAYTKRDSNFQIDIDSISLEGEGQLLKMKEELRKKLEKEGLFDIKHKKEIPFIPSTIGIITSSSGAVIHEMEKIISERFSVPRKLYSVAVQGKAAVNEIVSAIKYFNSTKIESTKADVLIIARGGGSIEDLWCFNDEDLVRSVFDSKIPIISAIGHEPDTNLIDFVADIRAATPTEAAEIVVPDRKELLLKLEKCFKNFENGHIRFYNNKKDILEKNFNQLKKPDQLLNLKKEIFFKIKERFFNAEKNFQHSKKDRLKNIIGKFNIGSHQNTLKRGYTYIKNLKNDLFVKNAKEIKDKTNIKITFHDGIIKAITKKK